MRYINIKVNKVIFTNALCFFVFTLSGCLQTRGEVRETEQRQTIQQQVVSMQRVNADSSSRVNEIEEQIRELSGKVDGLEEKISRKGQNFDGAIKSNQGLIAEQNQKINLLQEALTKMEGRIIELTGELNSLKSEKVAAESAAASTKASKKNLYETAQDHFEQKEWKKSILSFQKYRDENPKGPLVGDSTYKIGVCFQELGMKDEAKAFYEEVIAKFPKSSDAKRAKSRLKSLKK